MGLTPSNNERAVRAFELIGMKRVGILPRIFRLAYENGRKVDGILSIYDFGEDDHGNEQ